MTRRFLLSAALVAGLMATTSSFAANDTVVAVVDGKKITFAEVMEQKESLGKEVQGIPEDKLFPLLQNKLVNDIVIEKAAMASNIAEQAEVKEALEKLREQFLIQAFLADKIKAAVSDADVKAKYEELVKNFPKEKEAKLRHIVLKDKRTADQVVKALKNGSDFTKLAKDKSEDKTTGKQGGEIGYLAKSMLPKDISEKVFDLKVGGYTVEPVKSELGWHVFKVDEYRDAKPPKFEEAKDELKSLMAEEALVLYMKELRDEAKVQLFDENGKAIPEQKETASKDAADKKVASK